MEQFKKWLNNNYEYTPKTINNVISRINRADRLLKIHDDFVYLYELEQEPEYIALSSSVRSQIKKSVSLYFEYKEYCNHSKENELRVLSMFSNIGVAEAYLEKLNVEVKVANELDARRAKLYSEIYPETLMIEGDITENEIFNKVVHHSKEEKVNLIMATPPCQGMSTAGTLKKEDERNYLFIPILDMTKEIKPKYVMIENVPLFLTTQVEHNGLLMSIMDVIRMELGNMYDIRCYVINTKDYSVPQSRERAIVLMTKKSENLKQWTLPQKDKYIFTMRDAIGHLPTLDPMITDVSEKELLSIFPKYFERKEKAESISEWHTPPSHIHRQVIAMQYTPTGKTAFDNDIFFPKKKNGERVKGFKNTYKRQNWDTPAYTVTMDNRKISSQNNVHPGRKTGAVESGQIIYSDARVLTVYEIMLIMSLPKDWPVPSNTSAAFLRRIIGEGIPSLFVKKLFSNLLEGEN